MEEINLYNDNSEVNSAIHKATQVFTVIKNTILKIDGKTITIEDKVLLSLLLGVEYTDNSINRSLKQNFYNGVITVYPSNYSSKECINIFNEYFKYFVDYFDLGCDFTIEELMFAILNSKLIVDSQDFNNFQINKLRLALKESIKTKKKIKTLQN